MVEGSVKVHARRKMARMRAAIYLKFKVKISKIFLGFWEVMERREIVNNNMDCILLDKIDFYLTLLS